MAASSLVGRASELDDLAERLASGRLITLIGVGGCGKTRLAHELALRVGGGFGGGVCWLEPLLELGRFHPLLPPDIARTSVLEQVDLERLGTLYRRAQVHSASEQLRASLSALL